MPGHVAQMQRLFQTAKASLRLDVRYAVSPNGAIDSRLPSTPEEGSTERIDLSVTSKEQGSETPSQEWRYSRAPRLLAESDVDVREPFPDASPQLPAIHFLNEDQNSMSVAEPPSSGFTSHVDHTAISCRETDEDFLPSSPQQLSTSDHIDGQDDSSSAAALEGPLTELRVTGDDDMDVDLADESPLVNHLNRRSRNTVVDPQPSPGKERMIMLSAPAKAAADSARVKRGMLSGLFPKPPTRNEGDAPLSSPRSQQSRERAATPCPDPLLHERGPVVLCPDPGLHYGSCTPSTFGYSNVTPSPNMQSHHSHRHDPHQGIPQTLLPFNRATATGSPVPMLKVKSPPPSPGQIRPHHRDAHDAWHSAPHGSHGQQPHRHRDLLNRDRPRTAAENFRPGWYYARDNAQTSMPPGPAMYSFSTAAAKVDGQDPAPDSRIRDSYRTDTLTPLARPPTRFRKNGMVALASARGVGKYYGTPAYGPRPPSRSHHPRPVQLHGSQMFRSSPPRSSPDSIPHPHLRKRSREVESPTIEILEDEPLDPKLRLEEGDEVIEVDDETRAAVRMSLYGAPAPITPSEAGRGFKELSPNVVAWRKGTRPPGSRKKRRPSYWDGDLEEVVRSPAARHVVSSPVKKDDVKSQQAEVEFHEDSPTKEMIIDDEPDAFPRMADEGAVLRDNVQMVS
ncbi:hypothetical protein A1O1_08085 [Capronia coronata CBS 617.96]|uniref:Uncharacterized protein n=1 Tax=Capronia coronata CBS 617.96 TaxID=1182541 RepID=W9XNA2_9EURO|nr:uncharacterized protein A1O1_08085 [Capronia coronata CBS 617.96]EXJ82017.1 hypothetical protein A1O1_08085 [Capronia coronata CBS 617.96]